MRALHERLPASERAHPVLSLVDRSGALRARVALLAAALFSRRDARRRWPVGVATAIAVWGAVYVTTFNATITNEKGSVYGFLRYDHTIRWQDAADIYLEQHGGRDDWHIVVLDRERRAFDFNIAELSLDDRDRVMAYMVDRMPESAAPRSPSLLQRQARSAPRTLGPLSDQQI